MFSPSQVLPFIDIITNEVAVEVKKDGNYTDDPEAIAYNTKMYNKVMSSIDASLALLKMNKATSDTTVSEKTSSSTENQSEPSGFGVNSSEKLIGKTKEQQDAIKEVNDFLRGGKSDEGALSLKTLLNAVTPILVNFDEVLTQPNLDKYSATLNTSPIVGLAGRAIRYLNKTATGSGAGTITESWAHFDNLPADADTSKGAVHMFPYNGSFYLSVGKSVWRKEARPMNDNTRVEAKNNWPKLFLDGWRKVGSQCMPEDNLASVSAYAASTIAGDNPTFSLFSVDQNGKMKVFKGNDLVDNVRFSDVSVKFKGTKSDVKWKKICYYAGKLYGLDSQSCSWIITVNPSDVTQVEIKDKTVQASIGSLTSNEEGLIALRDKKLYRQKVSKALDEDARAKEDKSWEFVIDSSEVTYVSVASPGCMLDLRSLTQQLRDQYLKTQIAVMPLVTTISRSSQQHLALLNLLAKDAAEYEDTDDEDEKNKIVKRAVARGVKGSLKIATAINKASVNSSSAIVNMGIAMRGVSQELQGIQTRMEKELEKLKETLEGQEKALKKIQDVQFWSLVVTLISAIVFIFSFALGAPWYALVILGALFVTGIIVGNVYSSKESQMIKDIATTKSEISVLKSSLGDIQKITPKFSELEIQYKALNIIWGGMALNSGNVVKWTNDVVQELALLMLDSVTIESGKLAAKKLQDSSQAYLDMLTAQGIYLPETDPDASSMEAFSIIPNSSVTGEDALQALLEAVNEPLGNGLETDKQEVLVVSSLPQSANNKGFVMPSEAAESPNTNEDVPSQRSYYIPSRIQLLTEQTCAMHSDQAIMALERGDFDAFEIHMDVSIRLLDAPTTLKVDTLTKSGGWFDIDIIKRGVAVWLNAGLKDLLAYNNTTLYLDGVGTITSATLLAGAKYLSAAVVMDTIKLAGIMQDWTKDANQDLSDEQKLAQAKRYVDSAAGLCGDLATITAKLNNGFNTINHAVRDARNKVIAGIKNNETLISAMNGLYWEKIARIQDDIPWFAQMFWTPGRIQAEIEHRANTIEEARKQAVKHLENEKVRLERLRDSGYIYQNHHITWIDLVQKLSTQFGRVFISLKSIQQGIKEDVVFNSDAILTIQWPELKRNAEQVLGLLNVNTNLDIPAIMSSGMFSNLLSLNSVTGTFSLEAPEIEDSDSAAFGGRIEDPMQFAVQVHPVLESLLANGADETRQFFNNINAILVLPHVETLKAYEKSIGPVSLRAGMGETISLYVRSFALIEKALDRIKGTSAVQSSRLKKLEKGDIEWKTFYKGTQQAIIASSRYLGTANDGLEKSYEELQTLFERIKGNRDMFEQKIALVDDAIKAERKKVDDYIFQLGADALAVLCVGVTAALAVVKGPSVAFKAASIANQAASKVDGFSTTNVFKTFYSKMDWADFKKSMASLGTLRDSLKIAVDSLDQILKCFADTVKYGKDLQSHLRESQQRLTDFETERLERIAIAEKQGQDVSAVMTAYFADVDFEEVMKGWDVIGDRCDTWHDIFNAQGYSLPTEFEL